MKASVSYFVSEFCGGKMSHLPINQRSQKILDLLEVPKDETKGLSNFEKWSIVEKWGQINEKNIENIEDTKQIVDESEKSSNEGKRANIEIWLQDVNEYFPLHIDKNASTTLNNISVNKEAHRQDYCTTNEEIYGLESEAQTFTALPGENNVFHNLNIYTKSTDGNENPFNFYRNTALIPLPQADINTAVNNEFGTVVTFEQSAVDSDYNLTTLLPLTFNPSEYREPENISTVQILEQLQSQINSDSMLPSIFITTKGQDIKVKNCASTYKPISECSESGSEFIPSTTYISDTDSNNNFHSSPSAERKHFQKKRQNKEVNNTSGHDCLRSVCNEVNLLHPEFINGTKLRKYIATVSQIFNLGKNEADWLARHLGHDIRIHRNFYRIHENAVETTKISRLLIAIEQGEASKYAGKSLDEIDIEDLPDLEDLEEPASTTLNKETHVTADRGNDTLSTDDEISLSSCQEEEPPKKQAKYDQKCENRIKKKKSESDRKLVNGVSPYQRKVQSSKTSKTDERIVSIKRLPVRIRKTPWTSEEIKCVLTFFKFDIKKEFLPGKQKCSECLETYEVLRRRKWTDIKYYLKNYYARNRRLIREE